MCGIVAVYGEITPVIYRLFKTMLNIDIVRGKDSTGVAHIGKDGKDVHVVKAKCFPYELMTSKAYIREIENNVRSSMEKRQPQCLIGHNRWATIGKVTSDNAHPFQHGAITLVHNGTLKTHIKVDDKTFDTDSESITYAVNEVGIAETYKKLDGAASLVWWDTTNQSFNMLSNGKRPLTFLFVKGSRTLICASESWIMMDAAERLGMEFESPNAWNPKDHQHFQLNVGEDGKIKDTITKLEPYTAPFYSYTAGGYHYPGNSTVVDKKEDWKTAEFWDKKNTASIIPFVGRRVTPEIFDKTYHTCFFCAAPLKGKQTTSVIIDDILAACHECCELADQHNLGFLS